MAAGGRQSHAVTEPQRDPNGGGGAEVRRAPTTESVFGGFMRKLCEAIASLKFFASMLLAYRFANASKKPRFSYTQYLPSSTLINRTSASTGGGVQVVIIT